MSGKNTLVILVTNLKENRTYLWNLGKFSDRLALFRNYYQEFLETSEVPKFADKETDPFWDQEEGSQNPFPEKKKKKLEFKSQKGEKNSDKKVQQVPAGQSSCCTIFWVRKKSR